MGGYGSGRWSDHPKKTTVEESVVLDLAQFKPAWFCQCLSGESLSGTLEWVDEAIETASFSVSFESWCAGLVLTLSYWAENENMIMPIQIQTTHLPLGGVRYWGVCPACERRVRKLYLPPGGRQFLCRACQELTYRSAQEAHALDRALRFVARHRCLPLNGRRHVDF